MMETTDEEAEGQGPDGQEEGAAMEIDSGGGCAQVRAGCGRRMVRVDQMVELQTSALGHEQARSARNWF